MRKVSLRLPEDLVAAYDSADGTRSAVMRRRLAEAVTEGELDGVDDDLRTLAEAEDAKDRARLARRRGSFRERCYDFFADKWRSGLTTPDDAADMAGSWEAEAALYGAEYVAFVDAVLDWYAEEWEINSHKRPGFPDPSTLLARSDPEAIDVPERLVETVRAELRDSDRTRAEVVDKLAAFHERPTAERAVALAEGSADE
jgi:hypothetical protein